MQYLPSMFLVNKIKFLFVLFLSLFFKNKANKKINFIYIFFMHANYHTCCILCVCGHVHVQLLALVSQDTAWIALRDGGICWWGLSIGGNLRSIFDYSNLSPSWKRWTSIKIIKIIMNCVYKEYEVKIKMVHEQWLQLKITFLLDYNIKIVI